MTSAAAQLELAARNFGAADITFVAESHAYFCGMIAVPSVSEILRTLSDDYLRSVPEDILVWKSQLGTAVHRACELLDLGVLDEDTVDEQVLPYLESYKQFVVDYRPQWDLIESVVFDPVAWYAGTLDRAGLLNGEPAVVDLKTSVVVPSYSALQVWAYAAAAKSTWFNPPDLLVLQLKKGEYKLHHYDDHALYRRTWDALVATHQWKKDHAT